MLPGVYTVSLVIGGKTIDTKPLRVTADPDVLLTDAQRRQMFDMAMEVHELQHGAADGTNAIGALTRQMTDLSSAIGTRSEIPADVKSSLDALQKELTALAAKLTVPAGGRGFGGRGGASENVSARLALAKNGLMAGMWPTEQLLRTYNDAKAELPKVIADLNGTIAKAATLSATLSTYNLTLTVPQPVKLRGDGTARKKTSTNQIQD